MKLQTLFLTTAISLTVFNPAAIGSTETAQKIKSVAQVKTELYDTLKILDDTNVCIGACQVTRQLGVCSLVENLDTQVKGKIFGRKIRNRSSALPIDKADVELMRLIYSQCKSLKPENFPPYLQLNANRKYKIFNPTCKSLEIINQGLGLIDDTVVNCN
ncbi:hypothetical protein H6G33_27490 [Calothrix sp. FACHB-1219]|uniref:hypothetical protein n=1 Tax=unclassified Calothrix TaxID=2619626 RepID=UPI001687B7AB|nr:MULTISPECIES: hypothetical protein [unclassified Calothrix]MBD2205924.1 hypothetical protein [Calothrix sp. FACHB-168]MBD2220753.1 hypothetical protein [Calothrix sp. FACHB-1219]